MKITNASSKAISSFQGDWISILMVIFIFIFIFFIGSAWVSLQHNNSRSSAMMEKYCPDFGWHQSAAPKDYSETIKNNSHCLRELNKQFLRIDPDGIKNTIYIKNNIEGNSNFRIDPEVFEQVKYRMVLNGAPSDLQIKYYAPFRELYSVDVVLDVIYSFESPTGLENPIALGASAANSQYARLFFDRLAYISFDAQVNTILHEIGHALYGWEWHHHDEENIMYSSILIDSQESYLSLRQLDEIKNFYLNN